MLYTIWDAGFARVLPADWLERKAALMSTMEAEVFDAFRSIGVGDEKAMAAAEALSRRDPGMVVLQGDVGTVKADVGSLKSDVSVIKGDVGILKTDVATLKTDVATLKIDVGTLKTDVSTLKVDVSALKIDTALLKWMTGFTIALMVTVLLKLFVK